MREMRAVRHILNGAKRVTNHFRFAKESKSLIGGLFIIGLLSFGVLGLTHIDPAKALTRNCDNNAIIYCGAADANEFRTKYDQNAPGDLPAIYGHYWIPRDIQVVYGQSYRDGTVRVNGRVVATNSQSIGRQAINGSHPISIAGRTYFETPNSAAFISDGLDTMVALDGAGNFKYAVLSACGNPIYATPVPPVTPPPTPPTPPPTPPPAQPKYSCDSLTIQNLSSTNKRLTISGSASGGAQIIGYGFDFGDGLTQESTSAMVDHGYSKPGTYTVTGSIKVRVGTDNKFYTSTNCKKSFTIVAPAAYGCTSLTASSRGGTAYDFTIQKSSTNAEYVGASFDYGDGQTEQVTGTAASHTYAKPGNYTIVATLRFNADGVVKESSCSAQITNLPCATNPSLPKDSPNCTVCAYNSTIPKDSPNCVPPTPPVTPPAPNLPQTGPADMVLGSVGFGSTLVASSLYVSSRRDFLMTLLTRK